MYRQIAGADLKRRIEFIMWGCVASEPSRPALAFIGCAAMLLAVMAGITSLPRKKCVRLRRGSGWIPLAFSSLPRITLAERLHAGEGQLRMRNMALRELISIVYGINQARVFGGPPWLDAPSAMLGPIFGLWPRIRCSTDR